MSPARVAALVVAGILSGILWGLLPVLSIGQASAEAVTTAGGVVPVSPVRALDTRNGTGAAKAAVAKGASVTFAVLGRGEVPTTGVSGVFLNVTATGATGSGYVTAYTAGTAVPNASNLSVRAGQTIPNLVFVPLGSGGRVSLYNGTTGSVQLVADTAGYVVAGAATRPGAAVAVAPSRVLDTRNSIGAPKAVVGAGRYVEVVVAGHGNVPASGASGVWLNVTVTNPTAGGYVSVSPGGVASSSSNLNFTAGQTIPNLVFVPFGAGSKVRLFNGSPGTVDLVADTAGYVLGGTIAEPGTAAPVSPSRILDTRSGVGTPSAAVPAGGSITLQAAGRGNLPAADQVAGVFLNVTVTKPTTAGYLSVFPAGQAAPNASNLNFVAGQTIPNLVLVPVDDRGRVQLRNGSTGTLHLIADTAGYVRRGAEAPPVEPTVRVIGDSADFPSMPSVSDDGGVVAYLDTDADQGGSRKSVRVWTRSDNQTRTIATADGDAFVDQPQVVGDGSEVYFSSGDGGVDVTIKRWTLATGQTSPSAVPSFQGYRFLVSRDGTRLAHDVFDEAGGVGIVLGSVNGGAEQVVAGASGYANLDSISSDGSFVGYDVYTEDASGGGTQVARVWAASSNTSVVVGPAQAVGSSAMVSDDGSVAVWLNGNTGVLNRWVRGAGSTPISPDGFRASYPAMSADGRLTGFESTDFGSHTGIRLADRGAPGSPYVLGDDVTPDVPTQPDLSSDGRWLAFVSSTDTGSRVAIRGPHAP